MKTLICCLAAGVLLGACSDRGGAPTTPTAQARSASPSTVPSGSVAGLDSTPAAPSISLSVLVDPSGNTSLGSVRSVFVTVHARNAPAMDQLGIQLTSPSGSSYQHFTASLPDSTQQEQTATFRLPVAGTFISTYKMVGTWQAHLLVQGQERTVQPFELTP